MNVDLKSIEKRIEEIGRSKFKYYYPQMHVSSFTVPTYVLEALETKGDIIKDDAPFIWKA